MQSEHAASRPRLIFIYGPAAVGKLTVAREIERRTGLPVFHNHLVVDALLAVFDFGSEPFRRLREQMWLAVFADAMRAGRSMLFTFAPEATVAPDFIERVVATVSAAGGEVAFVELRCAIDVQESRVEAPSRTAFRKLGSLAMLRDLRTRGADRYAMPAAPAIAVDTGLTLPNDAAETIVTALNLPRVPAAARA